MFAAIINFFEILIGAGREEIVNLRKCLISVLVATAIGAVAILVFRPSVGVSMWITLLPWAYTTYRLFSIRRFIAMHITGEMLEALRVSVSTSSTSAPSPATPDPAKGSVNNVLDNDFIRMYISVITGMYLVQTALFLFLPLYVNYTMGGMTTAIVIAMLSVIIAIDNLTSFRKMSRAMVKVAVVAYVVGLTFVLFPQIGFYLKGVAGDVNVISMSTAKKVNDLDSLQKKQQEKIDNDFIDGVIAWQKENPGVKPPKEYEDAISRARKLGMLKSRS